ncbi:MAG: SRPBCC domain-containing protein [candidate division Zixibacteria bacterium]|nr:SRPBCC domain-containing protein [Candidatus Tariuqbacter arcticus]
MDTKIEIHTPIERVWEILTDFDSYPDWNPFIRRIEGEVKEGTRLEIFLQPASKKGKTCRQKVNKVVPPTELLWIKRMIIPGLLTREHIFSLERLSQISTLLVHREHYFGILIPFLRQSLQKKTQQNFEMMNSALMKRAEH